MTLREEFTKGFWKENPVLVLLLGLCPTLAVTTGVKNGMGMGLATTFVLLGSNIVVSLIRDFIPKKVRIPCYIVIIATFVTLVEMITAAYFRQLYVALGIFIPLIVVNCTVLGRAEAFASRNNLVRSVVDALGMGLGFTVTLMALGGVREFFSGGALYGIQLVPDWDYQFLIMTFPPGAFIVLGLFVAGMNWITARRAEKEGGTYAAPPHMNCAQCRLCTFETGENEKQRKD